MEKKKLKKRPLKKKKKPLKKEKEDRKLYVSFSYGPDKISRRVSSIDEALEAMDDFVSAAILEIEVYKDGELTNEGENFPRYFLEEKDD